MARRQTPKLSMAVEEYLSQHARRRQGKRPDRMPRSYLRRFVARVGDRHTGSVTPVTVADAFYGEGGFAETCSRETLANVRGIISSFFLWCHAKGYVTNDGAHFVSLVTERSTKRNIDRDRLTRTQLMSMIENAPNPRDRCLVAFVANTGVRIGEAQRMRIRDVSLERGEMYVFRPKPDDIRTYPITCDLDAELRRWLTIYSEYHALKPAYFLFPAWASYAYGDPRPTPLDIKLKRMRTDRHFRDENRVYLGLEKAAGIDHSRGQSWHRLRRSVARVFFDDVVTDGEFDPLRMTQALLGHKNGSTTEAYIGIDAEKRRVDAQLRGRPFLTRGQDGTVIPMRAAGVTNA